LAESTGEPAADAPQGAAAEQPEGVAALSDHLDQVTGSLPGPVQDYLAFVESYPLAGSLTAALVFWVLAFVMRDVVLRGFERLASRTSSPLDNTVIAQLRRPVFTTVLFFGLMLAINLAGLPVGTSILLSLLASVIVMSWMIAGMRLAEHVLAYFNQRRDISWIEPRTIPAIDLVAKLGLILVGSYALLLVWGVNPVGWIASAGIVGIAVGFAAKDTLANLFAGFFIVADAPYKIGDYINLDTGERGEVTRIGLRSTRLLTRDDVEITVPNGLMGTARITNESGGRHQKVRIRIPVGVAYGSDVDQVIEVLMGVAAEHAELCQDPEPRVRLRGFGASSLDFQLLAWIEHPVDRGRISHELHVAVYKAFEAEGITIPFAQTDLHIRSMPAPPDDPDRSDA
jgi:small-conductance mechanosensitive channel